MKYIEKFSYLRPGEVEINILRSDKPCQCLMCKTPTYFIDVCSEAHFCSEECEDEFYYELEKAERERWYDLWEDLF